MKIKLRTEIKVTDSMTDCTVTIDSEEFKPRNLVKIMGLADKSITADDSFTPYINSDNKPIVDLLNFTYRAINNTYHIICTEKREFFDVKSFHEAVLEQLTEAIDQIKEINNTLPHIVGMCETEEEV